MPLTQDYGRLASQARYARSLYPEGSRVRLISTTDRYTNLQPGDEGVVSFVDGIGTVHIDWDQGSRLGMCLDEDKIERVE